MRLPEQQCMCMLFGASSPAACVTRQHLKEACVRGGLQLGGLHDPATASSCKKLHEVHMMNRHTELRGAHYLSTCEPTGLWEQSRWLCHKLQGLRRSAYVSVGEPTGKRGHAGGLCCEHYCEGGTSSLERRRARVPRGSRQGSCGHAGGFRVSRGFVTCAGEPTGKREHSGRLRRGRPQDRERCTDPFFQLGDTVVARILWANEKGARAELLQDRRIVGCG